MAMNNASKQNPIDSAKAKKSHELPESLVNLELQSETYSLLAGYLGTGIKLVVGAKNTGILAGFSFGDDGFYESYKSLRLGYQYGISRGFYANSNLNMINLTYSDYTGIFKSRTFRLNLGAGYTLSFGKKKRWYYNIETSIALINTKSLVSRLTIYSGIGFRLGTPAKTSYEGVKNVTTVPMK